MDTDSTATQFDIKGTEAYRPPRPEEDFDIHKKDPYSLGLTILELLGQTNIDKVYSDATPDVKNSVYFKLEFEILKRMLNPSVNLRYSFTQLNCLLREKYLEYLIEKDLFPKLPHSKSMLRHWMGDSLKIMEKWVFPPRGLVFTMPQIEETQTETEIETTKPENSLELNRFSS